MFNLRATTLYSLIFALVFSFAANAVFAPRLNYQGRLTNSNGVPLADANYSMRFDICTDSACATSVWNETQAAVAVSDGLFSAVLGDVTAINLDFNSTAYWVRVTVGGTVYAPAQRITPAAMAINSDLLDGQHGSYYMTAATDNWVNTGGDTMTGALNMTANIVPTADGSYNLGDSTHRWAAVNISSGALTDSAVVLADLAGDSVNSAKIVDLSVATGDVAFNFIGSIDSITNKGGNVDFTSANNLLTITSNDTTDTVTLTINNGNIDHNSLSNLTTGDPHTQYFNLSQSETVSGIPAFNGGTTGSSAPFSVDSTYAVSNLNADLLDGYHVQQTGNFGQWESHGTYTDCNTNPNIPAGWNYVQGTTNCPNSTSSQWYRGSFSLGSNYPLRGTGGYSLEIAIPRMSPTSAGLWMRTVEGGTIGGWTRIDGSDPNAGAWTLSGTNLYPDSTSYNVGIGVTSVPNKLHVGGAIGATSWIGAGCEGSCESSGGYSILYADGTSVQTSSNRADGGYNIDGATVVDAAGQFFYNTTAAVNIIFAEKVLKRKTP